VVGRWSVASGRPALGAQWLRFDAGAGRVPPHLWTATRRTPTRPRTYSEDGACGASSGLHGACSPDAGSAPQAHGAAHVAGIVAGGSGARRVRTHRLSSTRTRRRRRGTRRVLLRAGAGASHRPVGPRPVTAPRRRRAASRVAVRTRSAAVGASSATVRCYGDDEVSAGGVATRKVTSGGRRLKT
jgi:hypothetical protein